MLFLTEGIRPYKHPLIKNVYVGQRFNEADEYILDLLSEKDIVVTNDILLAHECIKKFASVLKYSGEILNKTNIANEVSKRNLMTEIRSSDPFHLSKSKPFLKKYKSNFLNIEKLNFKKLSKIESISFVIFLFI